MVLLRTPLRYVRAFGRVERTCFQVSARLKSGPDTCLAMGCIVVRRHLGIAAYGARNHFFVLTQGLRTWG